MLYLILSAISIQLVTLIRVPFYNFFLPLNLEVYIYSIADIIFVCIVVFIFWSFSRNEIKETLNKWTNIREIEPLTIIISFLFCSYSLYLASTSVSLIIIGATRQDLINEYDMFGMGYLIVSSYFKVIMPLYLITNVDKKFKILLVTGFLSSMLITASRNEMVYAGYLIATIFTIFNAKRSLFVMVIVITIFSIIGFILTIIQGRPVGDGFSSIFLVIDKHILYRSYSLYLAERVLDLHLDVNKFIYPFFGYISERFLSSFYEFTDPINNEFVSSYKFIGYDPDTGSDYFANVLYPWWSWFILAFGAVGLIVKSLFCSLILYVEYKLKLTLTIIYTLSILMFSAPFYTPLITVAGVLSFIWAILCDVNFKRIKSA